MTDLILSQHVRWREPYISHGLNKKFSGVTEPGVYYGFLLSAGPGLSLNVSPEEDFAESVAVVERNGYSVVVRAADAGNVVIPATGTFYVCVEAFYTQGDEGYQHIVFRASPEEHHVVLGKITVPSGTTQITEAMISEDGRIEGNPTAWLIQIMTKFVEAQTDIVSLDQRLSNLENWALTQGYDPETTYMGS